MTHVLSCSLLNIQYGISSTLLQSSLHSSWSGRQAHVSPLKMKMCPNGGIMKSWSTTATTKALYENVEAEPSLCDIIMKTIIQCCASQMHNKPVERIWLHRLTVCLQLSSTRSMRPSTALCTCSTQAPGFHSGSHRHREVTVQRGSKHSVTVNVHDCHW